MTIQWFPGHMAKAKREIEEKLPLVDLVVELLDARSPISSRNPMLQEIIQEKQLFVLLMKNDLANPTETTKWLDYFQEQKTPALAINVNHHQNLQKAMQQMKELGIEKQKKARIRGIKERPVRAMILGIPNVGKSTLINRLANRKAARIGDRPGITRHQQWIKVEDLFELLDTPGILWPKFEDRLTGLRLAALGTLQDHMIPIQDVAAFVIQFMQEENPAVLAERFSLDPEINDMWEIFEIIGKKRGALQSGGRVNFDQVAQIILRDLRTGRLGGVTLEKASEQGV